MIFLLATLTVSALFSYIILTTGTWKGWIWMEHLNDWVFGINAVFALAYVLVGKVKTA